MQLYGLNQAYAALATGTNYNGDSITGANAQANDTAAQGFLSTGSFTATAIGAELKTGSGSAGGNAGANTQYSFTLPAGFNSFVFGNKITLALTATSTVVGATPLRVADQSSAATTPASPLTFLTFQAAGAQAPEPATLAALSFVGVAFARRRR